MIEPLPVIRASRWTPPPMRVWDVRVVARVRVAASSDRAALGVALGLLGAEHAQVVEVVDAGGGA